MLLCVNVLIDGARQNSRPSKETPLGDRTSNAGFSILLCVNVADWTEARGFKYMKVGWSVGWLCGFAGWTEVVPEDEMRGGRTTWRMCFLL